MWILVGIAVAAIIGLSVWGVMSGGSGADRIVSGSEDVYYFGAECPHCADVKKFLEENGVREKVSFSEKEVWHNKQNASEMEKRAQECGLDTSNIGVPFLWMQGKCFVGYPDVVQAFRDAVARSGK